MQWLLGTLLVTLLGGCAPSLIPLTQEESVRLARHRDSDPNDTVIDWYCDLRLEVGGRPTVLKDGTRVYQAVWVFPPECGALADEAP